MAKYRHIGERASLVVVLACTFLALVTTWLSSDPRELGVQLANIPEPVSLALFGTGLVGLAIVTSRRRARRLQR